jgi:hypothetical protein
MTTNIVVTESSALTRTKVPALPLAPVEYDRQYVDTTNNILRLYFNTLDNFVGQLSIDTGTAGLPALPHIAAQDDTDQYATATNTATKVLWNTLDSGYGFTLNLDSTATPTYTGVYKIDYSLQFFNTYNQIQDAFIWLQIDGVNVPGSASIFSVPNSHGGVDGALVAYSSITFSITAGQDVGLYWATNRAATSGGATGVYMHASPAQVSPFAMPSIPSALGSIVFVSGTTP